MRAERHGRRRRLRSPFHYLIYTIEMSKRVLKRSGAKTHIGDNLLVMELSLTRILDLRNIAHAFRALSNNQDMFAGLSQSVI